MAVDKARKNLGRGLASLFGDGRRTQKWGGCFRRLQFKIGRRSNRRCCAQAAHRLEFDADQLATLSEFIKTNGIIQPILVRRSPENKRKWEIVAGERRWRAAAVGPKAYGANCYPRPRRLQGFANSAS